jgi:hypothetical protein
MKSLERVETIVVQGPHKKRMSARVWNEHRNISATIGGERTARHEVDELDKMITLICQIETA